MVITILTFVWPRSTRGGGNRLLSVAAVVVVVAVIAAAAVVVAVDCNRSQCCLLASLGLSASFVCPLADAAALSCHISACLSLSRSRSLSLFPAPSHILPPLLLLLCLYLVDCCNYDCAIMIGLVVGLFLSLQVHLNRNCFVAEMS